MSAELGQQARELLDQMALGIECQRFLQTKLGAELVRRCTENHDAAMTGLLDADPTNSKEIRRIQNDARIPLMILEFIDNVISSGEFAEEQYQSIGKED
jgi:hypothetical protein